MSTYSRVRPRGLPHATPCQPSTTCGPEVPSPSSTRPPESWSSVATVITVIAGERAGICMIAVPIPICSVVAAIQLATVTASAPQASDVHEEWNPSRSASCASATPPFGSS